MRFTLPPAFAPNSPSGNWIADTGSKPSKHRSAGVSITIPYTQPHGRRTVYQRSIPADLRERYGKRMFKAIIASQQPAVVAREAARLTREIEAEWATMRGNPDSAPKTIRARAVALLANHGLKPLDGLVSGDGSDPLPTPQEAAIERLEAALMAPDGTPREPLDPVPQAAWQMLYAEPPATVSDLMAAYLKHHRNRDDVSFDKHTRIAFAALVSAIGDKPVTAVVRADARGYIEAALLSGHATSTVRRRVNVFSAAWVSYGIEVSPGLPNPWARLSIANEGKDKKTRHTFTDAELIAIVQACRAADSRSKGGIPDAPRLLMTMLVDTGARIAELAGLPMADLRLDAPVPHVVLQTHPWRSIKTGESRTIPLVGAALWAAQRITQWRKDHPRHRLADHTMVFPSYCDGQPSDREPGASASATLNKWLRGLPGIPAEATTYSTRHAMEDRLRNSDCPTPISDSMTGHGATNVRDEYGRGWTLERKQAELAKACHATIATVAQWV